MGIKSFSSLVCLIAAAWTYAGNLIVNGEFEAGQAPWAARLHPGATAGIETGGFESERMLTVQVPAELRDTENVLTQTVELDPNEPTRSYRITWWMRYKVMAEPGGGAGVMATFLNRGGEEIGRTGTAHLQRVRASKNEWQAIDQIKDGFWDSYELSFDLPAEATALRIECGLFRAAGSADFDRVILEARPNVADMLAEASPITVRITDREVKPHLSEQLFSLNAEYRYPGIYYGTLPAENPLNRRAAFAAALHRSGAAMLRFPGGMPCHHYFVEGEEFRQKFFEAFPAESHYYRNLYYPAIGDVLEFCREYGFQLNFQINTCFFVDAQGEIKPITDNKYKARRPELYSPDHLDEAADAFRRFTAELPADAIRYWEFGNEEFALMSYRDYARIIAAFLPAIRQYHPNAVITVTGNTWFKELCAELRKLGVEKEIDYFSVHYPWGDHWRPEPGGETDLDRFVCGKLSWELNARAHLQMLRDAGCGHIKLSGNETSVFKYHTWDAHRVIYTPAHGLLFTANWMEAMKIHGLDNLTFHDLESPYFGMILYQPQFDAEKSRYRMPSREEARNGDFLVLPSGYALQMLSRHKGRNVVATELVRPAASRAVLFDLLVSRDGEAVLLTLVNRGAVARQCEAVFDSPPPGEGEATLETILWKELDGLPQAPESRSARLELNQGRVQFELPPFSITQIIIGKAIQ